MKDKDKETGRDLITGYSTMSTPPPLEPWASSVNVPAFDTATRGRGVGDSKCRSDRHGGQGTVAKEPQTVLMRSSGIPHQRTFSPQTPRTTSLRVGKGKGHFTTSNADNNSRTRVNKLPWPQLKEAHRFLPDARTLGWCDCFSHGRVMALLSP